MPKKRLDAALKQCIKCGVITHSGKETRQKNKHSGWGLEETGKGGWTKFGKGGGDNIEGLYKIRGLGPL